MCPNPLLVLPLLSSKLSRSHARLEALPNLKRLSLWNLPQVEYIGEGGNTCFPSLGELDLRSLPNLKGLLREEVGEMCPSLYYLHLGGCPSLVLPPFPCLQSLWVRNSEEECAVEEAVKFNLSLKSLQLDGCSKLVNVPECIRQLSSLGQLHIRDLTQLTVLPEWLADLTSLEDLAIVHCPKLASLPDSIEGMTNLKYLRVKGCPDLERRCEEKRGRDWHKIAHIPNFGVDRGFTLG